MPVDTDTDFTEIVDAHINRVDLVGGAANGHKFLLAKSGGPMMTPADVRAMVERARLAKADESTATQDDLPDSDFAYIEPGGSKDDTGRTVPRSLRHFPIQDAAHVRDALSQAPQLPFGEKAMPAITAAAKKFGIDTDITKDAEDLSDFVPDTEPGSTADTTPGSEDWENKDAETAFTALQVLSRIKDVLAWLGNRESQEVAVGQSDDSEALWNLEDASYAVDSAIEFLAPYAAGEQIEATEAAETITKTATGVDTGALAAIEGYAAIQKAGRVLSAANESALNDAIQKIQSVLAGLPAAPEPVEKEATVPTIEAPEAVAKADEPTETDSSLALVYDANGNIIGAVDPAAITVFAATPTGTPSTEEAEEPEPVGDEPTSADLKPQPAENAGEPADAPVTKRVETTETLTVDDLLKGAEDEGDPRIAALVNIVKGLKEHVDQLEALPANPKAVTAGAPIPVLKGQSDPEAVDENTITDLKKALSSRTPGERNMAIDQLQNIALTRLTAALNSK